MKRKPRLASFSLVEILVGLAVFSLLMLLLLTIMGSATKLWRESSAKEDSFREARAALNALSRDMSAALPSTNPAWFYSDVTNHLAFLTTLPNTAQGPTVASGDICAVGYSLEWSTNDASGYQTNMSLYRYITFSGPTYTNYVLGSSTVGNVFTSVDGVNTVRELIARDIPQISFVAYTNDPSGAPWPAPNQSFLSNMTIEVGITAVNDQVAVLLTSQAQWQNTNSALMQKNEEQFALRVRPQGP